MKSDLGLVPAVLPRPDGIGKTRMEGDCFIGYDCYNHDCNVSEGCTDGIPGTCCGCVGCEYTYSGCRDCEVPPCFPPDCW